MTGPQSIVEQIHRAVAEVEVSSMQADSSTTATLILYDVEGNVIDTNRLTLDHPTVTVSIGVVEQKTVPVLYEYNGTPAEGYRVVGATGSAETITIVGKPEVIHEVSEIVISGVEMDVTGATRTMEKTIDITNYLPAGAKLATDQDSQVKVTVELEAEGVRTYEVPVENIEIQNIPSGYVVTPDQTTVTVSFKGYPSDLNELSAESITGTADASAISERTTALIVNIAGDLQPEDTVQIAVVVTKQEAEQPEAGQGE